MKKKVQVVETEGEGLEALLGEKVLLKCVNYFYAGVLAGVNDKCVLLEKALIVYDTGKPSGPYQDTEKLPEPWYIMIAAIESFGCHD